MEFEDLQAIWDTQNERPVFSINDSRLAVGLYQQRSSRGGGFSVNYSLQPMWWRFLSPWP